MSFVVSPCRNDSASGPASWTKPLSSSATVPSGGGGAAAAAVALVLAGRAEAASGRQRDGGRRMPARSRSDERSGAMAVLLMLK